MVNVFGTWLTKAARAAGYETAKEKATPSKAQPAAPVITAPKCSTLKSRQKSGMMRLTYLEEQPNKPKFFAPDDLPEEYREQAHAQMRNSGCT
ncbi:hypothetical protein AC578_8114 [Pseudocercospora eumusae]|uniref:Uncharacterized protein n=1 Tax=Pseudocercospora eumusae TaxID=321146 RepID=A0A139H0I4_9PEZI|nr:hypothetical protein AC578_8114 [Pseudocercospora eumusae]